MLREQLSPRDGDYRQGEEGRKVGGSGGQGPHSAIQQMGNIVHFSGAPGNGDLDKGPYVSFYFTILLITLFTFAF